MDISAISAAMPSSTETHMLTPPSADEVQEFEEMLGTGSVDFPENDIVSGLQKQQQVFDTHINQASEVISGTLTPQELVQSQHHLMNAMIGVDLAAKIAGSASQSINKLVTMQ